ncbi:MAG TPA: YeaH/YhbH family protein [Alphaproteobacteria bacterium]|nr:YeaH/YhbH family protein [Alphaproteobacteria bacterium]
MHIIDRRLNPKGKSIGNRQRFIRRARAEIAKVVQEASSRRNVADIAQGDRVVIPSHGLKEPLFRKSQTAGTRSHVLPGNKEFVPGDKLPRPPAGGGRGGREGSPDGGGEDEFQFVLSRQEFVDLFLEDLELPELVKKQVKHSESTALARAGFSISGSPSNLNIVRTMRNSLSRRIALKRPRPEEIRRLREELAHLSGESKSARHAEVEEELKKLLRRSKAVPFIDPIDVRYNRFESVPKPVTQAVMFCLMDVSGSMTESMKDLAKRFFMLLYLFLERRYRHVELVFIRHTHEAKEVDEQTFFYSTETGGTVVSTALEQMRQIVQARYSPADWNIYAAQASDGDNTAGDNERTASLLANAVLPVCQYFAYLEVGEHDDRFGRETALWRTYKLIAEMNDALAMRRVRSRSDIYPVFRELFSRNRIAAA